MVMFGSLLTTFWWLVQLVQIPNKHTVVGRQTIRGTKCILPGKQNLTYIKADKHGRRGVTNSDVIHVRPFNMYIFSINAEKFNS